MTALMIPDLPIPLAVEKVLFRLALLEGGRVTLARAFLELPLAIEVLEQEADKAADGSAIFKDMFGEFLAYDFPELKVGGKIAPPNDCPTCGRSAPEPAEAGQRSGLVCDTCYRAVGRASRQHAEGALDRLKHYWKGEQEEDPVKVAQIEHEIFYVALRLGGQDLTHTSVAAQSRLASAQVKDRLDRLAQRKYIQCGLPPSGDVIVFRLPAGLTYPETLYKRSQGTVTWDDTPTKLGMSLKPSFTHGTDNHSRPGSGPVVRARPSDTRPILGSSAQPPAPPPTPPSSKFNIVIKDKRERGTPRPPVDPQ